METQRFANKDEVNDYIDFLEAKVSQCHNGCWMRRNALRWRIPFLKTSTSLGR
jgi:hypothetical protein